MKKQRLLAGVGVVLVVGFLAVSEMAGGRDGGKPPVGVPVEWVRGESKVMMPGRGEVTRQVCEGTREEGGKCEAAVAGCGGCKKGSFKLDDPLRGSEFGHARSTSTSWQPILDRMEAETRRQFPPTTPRLIFDIGYTTLSDTTWLASTYRTDHTSIVAIEPNPTTFLTVQTETLKTYLDSGMKAAALNIGLGDDDYENKLFWLNKDGSRSSFQRVRGDDYEQVPVNVNVSKLDTIVPRATGVVVPVMKVSAGRWEDLVLKGGTKLLRQVSVIIADVTSIPGNGDIVTTLVSNNFTVYAMGCSSLGRIHQDRPWWWSSLIAVKPYLEPIAEEHVCYDFTGSTLYCDSPEAAMYAPQGCHNFSDHIEPHRHNLPPDTDPVETTRMASPATHRKLKICFLTLIACTVGLVAYYILVPLVQVFVNHMKRDEVPSPPPAADDW